MDIIGKNRMHNLHFLVMQENSCQQFSNQIQYILKSFSDIILAILAQEPRPIFCNFFSRFFMNLNEVRLDCSKYVNIFFRKNFLGCVCCHKIVSEYCFKRTIFIFRSILTFLKLQAMGISFLQMIFVKSSLDL